jgi:hypothetical protein
VQGKDFFTERAQTLLPLYVSRLREVIEGAAGGLRWMVGELVLFCFLVQVVVCLTMRDTTVLATLGIAAGVLAYYFGPVVLLRGDQPTHYLLPVIPLILVVAARGALNLVRLSEVVGERWSRAKTNDPALARPKHRPGLARFGYLPLLMVAPLLFLCANFYLTVLATLREYQDRAAGEQAAVDGLPLAGRTVACRNMSWFVDRNVRTILLPYATVAELEGYVRSRGIDGILVWDHETQLFFRATPYGSLEAFDRALRQSPVFDSPHVSGAWRYYAVRRTQSSRRQP